MNIETSTITKKGQNFLVTDIEDMYIRVDANQVAEIFESDPKKQLVESGIAYIRFCLANPHFRAIMTLSEDTLPLKNTVKPLLTLCLPHISPREITRRELLIRSLIYGGAVMLESGELKEGDEAVADIKQSILRTIDGY